MTKEGSELLKSVTIRFKKRQNRLLISKNSIPHFETFLKDSIGEEVVIINTNIGLGIYYASKKDCSDIIKQSVILYTLKRNDINELDFLYDLNLETLKINFSRAFFTFSAYPQLFLAYVKKFVHLRKQHANSKVVMPQLDNLYELALKELYQQGKLPFAEKIMTIDGDFFRKRKNPLLTTLADKMRTKDHFN